MKQKEVLEDKRILRIHDLIIHNYGEGRIYISLHAEINSDYSLIEAHEIIDDAERRVRNAFKCDITIHTVCNMHTINIRTSLNRSIP